MKFGNFRFRTDLFFPVHLRKYWSTLRKSTDLSPVFLLSAYLPRHSRHSPSFHSIRTSPSFFFPLLFPVISQGFSLSFIFTTPVSVHSFFRAHEYIKGEIARISLYSVKQNENNMFLSTFFMKTFALYCKTDYLCIRF